MASVPTRLASVRAVTRWHLFITLSHNPSLITQRKHRLDQPDDIVRWRTRLKNATKKLGADVGRKLKKGASSVIHKNRQRDATDATSSLPDGKDHGSPSGMTINQAYDDTAFRHESATDSPPASLTSPDVVDAQPTVTEATQPARHGRLSAANPFTGSANEENSRESESSA